MNRISRELLKIAREINASVLSNYYDNKIQKRKNALIQTFDEILKYGEQRTINSDFNIRQIYDILTDSLKDISQYAWINDYTEKSYNEAINKLKPINDHNWANFIPQFSHIDDYNFFKGDSNQTYNLYYTFQFADLQDVKKFVKFITIIAEETLAKYEVVATGLYFQCKTHRYLRTLISHNDTFKVFYYDKGLKPDIQKTIQELISFCGLKKTSRPYFSGKDVKQIDDIYDDLWSGKITIQQFDALNNNIGSFGQRLSKNISNHIIKGIIDGKKKHPNLTSQDCYQWVKKQFLTFVQYYANKLI